MKVLGMPYKVTSLILLALAIAVLIAGYLASATFGVTPLAFMCFTTSYVIKIKGDESSQNP